MIKTDLTALRLVDGSLLVGKTDTTCDESVTLVMPIRITPGYDPEGNQILIKGSYYVPVTDETVFTFDRKHIIVESTVTDNFAQYYMSFVAESFEISDQTLN